MTREPGEERLERKMVEDRMTILQALYASEQQFSSAFEHSASGVSLVSMDGRWLRVNNALCAMLGYARADLVGRNFDTLTHPDDRASAVSDRERVLAGEIQAFQKEKRYIHASGRVVWGHLSMSVVKDQNGIPLHFVSQVQDITAHKQATDAVRRSGNWFRTVFDNAASGIAISTSQGRFLQANAAYCRMVGYSEDELCQMDFQSLTHPDDRALNQSMLLELLAGKQPTYTIEKRYLAKDGSIVWGRMGVSSVYDDDNGDPAILAVTQDITEQKLALEELHRSQSLLAIAGRIGRIGGWAMDVGTRQATFSNEVSRMHGVTAGLEPGFDEIASAYAPRYRRRILEAVQACSAGGIAFDVELRLISEMKAHRWLRFIGEPEHDASGAITRIQGAFQDISERKQASEQRRRLSERLVATLESITDAFYTLDHDWAFTYINGAAEAVLHRSRIELLGRNIWDEFSESIGTSFQSQLLRAVHDQVTVNFEDFYAPLQAWFDVRAYPSDQGLTVYFRDVSERRSAQDEIMRLNEQLEERVGLRTAELELANRELEAFSHSVAHDLRAPLSTIEGFGKMLMKTLTDSTGEPARHYVQRMLSGVKQMGDMTDALLSLAQVSRASVERSDVDLGALAVSLLDTLREREPDRKTRITIEQPLPAWGDPRLLKLVMENLLGNAWKFSSKMRSTEISVGRKKQAHGADAYFVQDHGAGFDMAEVARLFGTFQRLHKQSDFAGTGVGLANVQRIVTRHGGRIWAESAEGQGATFYFTLGPVPG